MDNIFKRIKDLLEAPTIAPTKPVTKPETEPEVDDPMMPDPGVNPQPHAINRDVQLFIQNRVNRLKESVNEADHMVHPDKLDFINKGDAVINELLPTLSDSEVTYLEMIAAEGYEDLVAKVEKYSGLKADKRNLPALFQLVGDALKTIPEIEKSQKNYLEELALKTVLELPEFSLANDRFLKDKLRIDAKLETPDLSKAKFKPTEKSEDGLSPEETANMELVNSFEGISEAMLMRRFASLMITGGSATKLYLYNMVKPQLERIDKRLPNLYGIMASAVQLGYWLTPNGLEKAAAQAPMGSEHTQPEDKSNVYKITARAIIFPFLIHEISKGIYTWIHLKQEHQEEISQETIEDETPDMLVGPEIYKKVMAMIPVEKAEISNMVQKLLMNLKPDQLKDILAGNDRGKQLMNDVIKDAENKLEVYNKKVAQKTAEKELS